jgi:urease accessory protein
MLTRTGTEVRSSHLRAFALLARDGTTRIALVPEQAVLLAGDHVTVTVRVAAGQSLEIVEPGGTVAYAMWGRQARWDVTIDVEDGGSLLWRGEPFVVAAGANVHRHTLIDLAADARLLLRETLVLGRAGELAHGLVAHTEVNRDGRPLLVEHLDAAVGFGPHRVLDQSLHVGSPCDGEAMTLESGDLLHRWLGEAVHASRLRCGAPLS